LILPTQARKKYESPEVNNDYLAGIYPIIVLLASPWEIVAMIRKLIGFFFLFLLFSGLTGFFGIQMQSSTFNRDGSISQNVVIIPAVLLSAMFIFFTLCISELKEANENLTVIASKINTLNQSIVAVNQNIVAIYKENKGK